MGAELRWSREKVGGLDEIEDRTGGESDIADTFKVEFFQPQLPSPQRSSQPRN